MYKQNTFDSIDKIQIWILKQLFTTGEYITTRELKTLEVCNLNFCLSNPLNRNTNNLKRKWKFPLAIGEFAWHVSGSNNVDFIAYYARQWKDFSTDGELISQSCYGHKIFKKDIFEESQWLRLIKLLKTDKFSRRAVLNLYENNNGLNYFDKDIACACTIQFLIRNEKLDAIVNMRSNDLIWGLPYDIYLFTMLQELLSLELDIELGCYYHNVGSMHIYERHFKMGKEMLNDFCTNPAISIKMQSLSDLNIFLEYEELIRKESINVSEIINLPINNYWKNLLLHLVEFKQQKARTANKNTAATGQHAAR